jgi:predicted DNA-binding protein with PD1-like motif
MAGFFRATQAIPICRYTLRGHLQEAKVRPTCEIILTESAQHLEKQVDPESGLALIRFENPKAA